MDDDRRLIEAVVHGDEPALAALYDRYASMLFALALRILGNPPDAEETLGDVFWEVWRRPDRFDATRGSLPAYLITLTRSRAIDRLRSRKHRPERSGETAASDPSAVATDASSSPLEDTLLGEQRSRIRRAISALAREQREAIELSYYSGMSHSQIAHALGEPLGTVKSRIRAGLIQLRSSLRSLHEGKVP